MPSSNPAWPGTQGILVPRNMNRSPASHWPLKGLVSPLAMPTSQSQRL